jgi:hypothetical protein
VSSLLAEPSPEFVDAAEAFAHGPIPPEARDGDAFAAQVPVVCAGGVVAD